MDKKEILDILDNAKDDRGDVPMRLVRQALDKLSAIQPISSVQPEPDCVSRQAAIDAAMRDVSCIRTHEFNAGATRAADRIKQLPSAQPELHWIPCSKRLPEDGRCLVTRFDFVTNTCFLDILWYEKGVWWNRLYTGDFAVIAWTPLPEPYRGGGKE